MMSFFKNPRADHWIYSNKGYISSIDRVLSFHKELPGYFSSQLIHISSKENVELFVKEESSRFDLPSFKILGASWSIYKLLCTFFQLPLGSTSLGEIREHIKSKKIDIRLYAATDGNHGRAVAHMSTILNICSVIYIPKTVPELEAEKIRSEGENVTVLRVGGNYDFAINEAYKETLKSKTWFLIQDTSFEGYTEIPLWIVEGYTTLVSEIPFKPDLIIIPAGVGSFAQSVVSFYRTTGAETKVMIVEPDTANTVYLSLVNNSPVVCDADSSTIMDGLNCPTVSRLAYPILSKGVSYSVTVTDKECHEAVKSLSQLSVNAGPCGAATFAAYQKYISAVLENRDAKKQFKVVLVSTEAWREYSAPG